MLLCCQAVARPDYAHVQPVFESLFREHGLPLAIRTNNGPPFASVAAGGLSALAVWWVKLGIQPERIEPGHPEQDGRHERMHRTLKEECCRPPAANASLQQERFDAFRSEYNWQRPHQRWVRQLRRAVPVFCEALPGSTSKNQRIRERLWCDGSVQTVRSNGEEVVSSSAKHWLVKL
jgi:transposase InsO family protein